MKPAQRSTKKNADPEAWRSLLQRFQAGKLPRHAPRQGPVREVLRMIAMRGELLRHQTRHVAPPPRSKSTSRVEWEKVQFILGVTGDRTVTPAIFGQSFLLEWGGFDTCTWCQHGQHWFYSDDRRRSDCWKHSGAGKQARWRKRHPEKAQHARRREILASTRIPNKGGLPNRKIAKNPLRNSAKHGVTRRESGGLTLRKTR